MFSVRSTCSHYFRSFFFWDDRYIESSAVFPVFLAAYVFLANTEMLSQMSMYHISGTFVANVFCTCILRCLVCTVVSCKVCIVVVVSCVLLSSNVYLLYCVCIAVFTLDAGLLARSQYSEGPVTGHLDTGFSRFPCAYKQMLRRFPTFQVATTCFSCSPPDLNLLVTNFIFCIHVK